MVMRGVCRVEVSWMRGVGEGPYKYLASERLVHKC